ncbi:MAG: hypothetical protein HYX53_10370 [Chloroflexi bacterium]|nr:hypothetical protein [Chloroflexota bacterium]
MPGTDDETKLGALRARLGDQLLVDELADQLNRTRQLLTGNPEETTEAVLASMGGQAEVEARITASLAATAPLAEPDRFPEAHRLAMRALEVLDREGARDPGAPGLGPLSPVAEIAVEAVAEFLTKGYAKTIAGRLRTLYARRESQAEPASSARRSLARARLEMDRLAPGFGGSSPLTPVLAAGASVSVLASGFQYLGAIDFANRRVLLAGAIVLFVVFFLLSSVLLRGAAVAHRRSRMIMDRPLAALWETIGFAGDPPKDDSQDFAFIAIVLSALLWLGAPAIGVLFLVL